MDAVRVTRKLDGKGRLILPGDFREAAGFAPDHHQEQGGRDTDQDGTEMVPT